MPLAFESAGAGRWLDRPRFSFYVLRVHPNLTREEKVKMNHETQEAYNYFRGKFEEIYLDFVKTSLTVSAATVAAIVIFSNRFDQGEIPLLLCLSMVGFLFSVLCGVALQFYMCIDISGFLGRLEKFGLVQGDVDIGGSIRMKSSKKFLEAV